MGEAGFKTRVKSIMDATREIARGVSTIKGLQLLGCNSDPQEHTAIVPHAMIVCFAADDSHNDNGLNIYEVAEAMTKKGWNLNSLQNPASIHLCVTLKTIEHKDKFINNLRDVVEGMFIKGNLQENDGGKAAVYGMAGSLQVL